VTGLYGLLAILTGYHLSVLQLLTYIYSLAVAISLAFLLPHIRRQSPFENLALAWLYILDTFINTGCTAAFAVHWFLNPGSASAPVEGAPQTSKFDTVASVVLITFFTLLRLYLSLVVMAHARLVLGRNMEGAEKGRSPFAVGESAQGGWRGWVGRGLVAVGRGYWLGEADGDEWTSDMGSKFRSEGSALSAAESG
jgi:inositol phosphorylceramide synthase regulatory subunit